MLTKDKLLSRLVDLEEQKNAAVYTLQAVNGAIQECHYLLSLIELEQKELNDAKTETNICHTNSPGC